MTPGFHRLTTPFLCLVLLRVLSGCGVLLQTAAYSLPTGPAPSDPEPWRTGKNNYEPVIVTSNKNIIRIKYLSVGPNAEHEQVTQLISDHCHGAYTETNRVELRGYDYVEAECNHGTESLQ